MTDLKQLEEQLKKKSQKNLLETLGNILNLGFKEFKKNTQNILGAPKNGKNQITKELDNFENKIIEKRK